jgi:hypothetical protein
MKRKHEQAEPKPVVLRVWTYPQAEKALPYITSIMGSVREHWLDAQGQQVRLKRLTGKPGRPDRTAILAREEASHEGHLALDRLHDALEELRRIEVFCIDPQHGLGVIPFVHDERLAWLIYDLFDKENYRQWRYHDDPPEKRRPIAEALEPPPTKAA